MPWFPVDDGFHSHPKVLATSLSARGLWVTAGSWCSQSDHRTDGVVPHHVLASLGGTPELAAELCAAGLWRRTRKGYVFHDWFYWGPKRTAKQQEELSAVRAINGRKGGLARSVNGVNAAKQTAKQIQTDTVSATRDQLGNEQAKRVPDQDKRRSNLLSKTEANAKQMRSPLDPV